MGVSLTLVFSTYSLALDWYSFYNDEYFQIRFYPYIKALIHLYPLLIPFKVYT